jgi:hypothetical protein
MGRVTLDPETPVGVRPKATPTVTCVTIGSAEQAAE